MEWLAFGFVLFYILIGQTATKLRDRKIDSNHEILFHSFTSGILLAGLLFIFLQEVYTAPQPFPLLLVVGVSFTFFYGLTAYQKRCEQINKKNKYGPRLKLLKFVMRSVHHLLIGMLFAHWAHEQPLNIVLTSIPLLFLKTVGTFELAEKEAQSKFYTVVVEAMTLVGFFLTVYTNALDPFFFIALAFVAGGIFHVIITRIFTRIQVNILAMVLGQLIFGVLLLFPSLFAS